MFVCEQCSTFLDFRCAVLPLFARHEYDIHQLKLAYVREDDSGEYYFLICEEERSNPDYWFYCCKKCDFSAHTECVLGDDHGYPIFGRNITTEYHRHLLTFAQRKKLGSRCDVCDENIGILGVERTKCQMTVHYNNECIEKITKNKFLR